MASKESSNFQKVLEFKIYKCSSFSSCYVPENILVDKPSDQTSRWSSDIDTYPQFLILKLRFPSIVKTITFGKYEKTHVCNIKKFKIYGSLEPQNMMELLENGLRNDSISETFDLKHMLGNEENYFPVRYIKIVPLQSWGPSFNFSIWHVQLTGTDDVNIVKPSIEWFNAYRQKEVIRLCMKHFRKLEQSEIVETLQRVTGVPLEDPTLTRLYDLLVIKGDHLQAECFISNAVMKSNMIYNTVGLLNDYINAQTYRAVWTKLSFNDGKPGMRGGHQMVLDPIAELLYLFGGWDGNQDLSDLWVYNIASNRWTIICKDTEAVGGPSARSCHKMCLDPDRRQLFTLGKYLDAEYRTPENLKSDFFVYDIESNKWTQISEDTFAVGGPQLIFDHQMSMDVEKRTIYIFGGRVLVSPTCSEDHVMMSSSTEPTFSGLYSYHVPTGTWNKLACDIAKPCPNAPTIRSRAGHSMLFHPGLRRLYIFAGQRGKEDLSDFFTYEVDTNHIEHIFNDFGAKDSNHVPAAGFTQRATIDPELGEIYVLSGLSKDKGKRFDSVQNSFWVYSIKNNKWSCIYRNDNVGEKYWSKMQDYEPCPRYAHQLVYDHVKKVHFLFGGNPGRSCLPNLRLDDFWQLKLCRPSHEQILKRCKLLIRKHKFKELALNNSVEALEYLQTKVSEIIDHNDVEQTKEFQLLTSLLFREQNSLLGEATNSNSSDAVLGNLINMDTSSLCYSTTRDIHSLRTELYDKLTEFFPESSTQPRANLIDLLPL
ncbi:muskelin isoform X1 [Bombus bifarius]|uniref:Muskelin isoform X1 n=1 Tax=Bombus bifarius TaxID=103933 RepID=A0A6P8N4E2_9HYME|nr:muskelin isoform X1 [Bombus vancouverensis nearcticus]XP_033315653.1 muskelin isoform X1 [Bombus bifarius]